ncbi:Putative restriction endonuclease [Herminiimonas arsenicoxydans]|uniref:Restriction endonuclease n=1 Tax=Herminiimonas arsenicoxydans TaxID=204773 RepID=A4G161_HERAR|nr:Putative restriction endonuclease [Herminiimonas arsenicoxydans]
MARKRKQSGIDALIRSPWWVSAILGAVGYIVLRWITPTFFASNPLLAALGILSRSIAWLAPCAFGVLALFSFFANKRTATKLTLPPKHKFTDVKKPEPSFNINPQDKLGNTPIPATSSTPDVSAPAHPPTWSIESLRSLEWKRFELLCAQYYEAAGFKAVTIAAGADGGIDVKLFKIDPNLPIAIVQCKAWRKAVGVKEVRELLGVMAHEKVARGIFITNGSYTPDALAFGASNPIQLLDGQAFLGKIIDLDATAQDKLIAFAFDGDYRTPTCASCGIKLVKRKTFWGCTNFPRCRTTIYFKNAAT